MNKIIELSEKQAREGRTPALGPAILSPTHKSKEAAVSWNAKADGTIEGIRAFEELWPGVRYKVTAMLPYDEIAGGEE